MWWNAVVCFWGFIGLAAWWLLISATWVLAQWRGNWPTGVRSLLIFVVSLTIYRPHPPTHPPQICLCTRGKGGGSAAVSACACCCECVEVRWLHLILECLNKKKIHQKHVWMVYLRSLYIRFGERWPVPLSLIRTCCPEIYLFMYFCRITCSCVKNLLHFSNESGNNTHTHPPHTVFLQIQNEYAEIQLLKTEHKAHLGKIHLFT